MSEQGREAPGRGEDWLETPRAARIIKVLVVLGVLFIVADLFYDKHVHYGFETVPGFHAALGFFASVLFVFAGVALRKVVGRREDYYGEGPEAPATDAPLMAPEAASAEAERDD